MKTRLKRSICKTSTKMLSTLHATVLYCIISEYVSFERQWVISISSFLNGNIYLNFCIGLQICNSNPIIHCTKWVFSSISGAKKPNWVWLSIFCQGGFVLNWFPFCGDDISKASATCSSSTFRVTRRLDFSFFPLLKSCISSFEVIQTAGYFLLLLHKSWIENAQRESVNKEYRKNNFLRCSDISKLTYWTHK